MNDQIYRQTILDAIDANVGILYDSPTLVTSLKKMVNALPPALPTRPCELWQEFECDGCKWRWS